MKKLNNTGSTGRGDGLNSEYRFDYSKARTNRFAGQQQSIPVFVELAPDVAMVFKNGAAVNAVLRSIMKALPDRGNVIPGAQGH